MRTQEGPFGMAWGLAVMLFVMTAACSGGCGSNQGSGPETKQADTATDEKTVPDRAAEQPPVTASLSVATYNAGLAHNFVPLAAQRRDLIGQALAAQPQDVICLQEVWEPDDIQAIIQAVSANYPHTLWVDTTLTPEQTDPACTEEQLQPLSECVNQNCRNAEDLTGCVMTNCAQQFGALPQKCVTCLAANIAKPMEEILTTCQESAAQFSYEGRNGLLLLSRHELATSQHEVMDSFLVQRIVIHARVDLDTGPVNLFCTHLTAPLSEVPYDGSYGSWEEEQGKQIDQLAAYVKKEAGDEPAILMGDMNCGPAVPPDIQAQFPDNYQHFLDAGLTVPYPATETAQCTWCSFNDLISEEDEQTIIDHIMLLNVATPATQIVRILDAQVTVETLEGPKQTYLSDHFGVTATVEFKR